VYITQLLARKLYSSFFLSPFQWYAVVLCSAVSFYFYSVRTCSVILGLFLIVLMDRNDEDADDDDVSPEDKAIREKVRRQQNNARERYYRYHNFTLRCCVSSVNFMWWNTVTVTVSVVIVSAASHYCDLAYRNVFSGNIVNRLWLDTVIIPVSMFVSKNSYLNLVLALECWYKDSKHVYRSPVGDEERTRPEWVEDTLSVLSFIVMFVNFYIATPKYCYVHLWFDTHTPI